ncbi:MAG: RluA family pseudouridine synthase [candidate division Zixibacteria bacterium]|nr:RluA family pseudouridine synthase [candidate division Zixibacteria bacterium]
MSDIDDELAGETTTHDVPPGIGAERLDKYIGNNPEIGLSRSRAQKLIFQGMILVNGERALAKHVLTGGEIIQLTIPPIPVESIKGEDIPLDIVHEDAWLVVVNKPAGMVTHPGVGNRSGTLANALVYHFDRLSHEGGRHRPGIVHRLDKETSGLLVVAKDDETHLALQELIKTRELKRTYLGLICGHMKEETGTIDLPIGRNHTNRTLMAVNGDDPREAVTHYRLVERYRSYDLLEVSLETGRTHQIRVHFSHLGHPVFGDPDYGGRDKWVNAMFGPERPLARRLLEILPRQALHAAKIEFPHPKTGEKLEFEAKIPGDFATIIALLQEESA